MILQGPGVPYRFRLYEPQEQLLNGMLRFEMYGYDASIVAGVEQFLNSENKILDDFHFDVTIMTPEQVEAWQYLHQTDWYTVREVETGEAMPGGVEIARSNARMILEEI